MKQFITRLHPGYFRTSLGSTQTVIRKFCRNLILRSLIVAFTGDHAAGVFEEPSAAADMDSGQRPAAVAMQALEQAGSGWHMTLLSATVDQVMSGPAL